MSTCGAPEAAFLWDRYPVSDFPDGSIGWLIWPPERIEGLWFWPARNSVFSRHGQAATGGWLAAMVLKLAGRSRAPTPSKKEDDGGSLVVWWMFIWVDRSKAVGLFLDLCVSLDSVGIELWRVATVAFLSFDLGERDGE